MPKKKKTNRGALIKGMSKRLPKEILNNSAFAKKLKEIMRGYAGIYALYNNGKTYYVGMASNLYWRVKTHLRDRHKGKWDSFVVCRIMRVKYLKDIETLMLRLFEPKGNKIQGKVPMPRDKDINYILKDILREHKYEIRGIEKALK
jgi:predicted GIY-YIG superfamily endonuclease